MKLVLAIAVLGLAGCRGSQLDGHSACYVFVWNAVVTCFPEPDPHSPHREKYRFTIEAQ